MYVCMDTVFNGETEYFQVCKHNHHGFAHCWCDRPVSYHCTYTLWTSTDEVQKVATALSISSPTWNRSICFLEYSGLLSFRTLHHLMFEKHIAETGSISVLRWKCRLIQWLMLALSSRTHTHTPKYWNLSSFQNIMLFITLDSVQSQNLKCCTPLSELFRIDLEYLLVFCLSKPNIHRTSWSRCFQSHLYLYIYSIALLPAADVHRLWRKWLH
jgi:hypothetical protein